ncbi:MAG: FAD-dependent oxidoreductase, partial [Chloroflexota bacterium]
IKNNKIIGVLCLEARVGEIVKGKRQVQEIPGTDHIIPGNLIIWAVGQWPDFSFLPRDGSIATRYPDGLWSDENLMTTLPGVFVAGDVRRGMTTFVVDAVGEGHHIGRSVDRYLSQTGGGVPEPYRMPVSRLDKDEVASRIKEGKASSNSRSLVRTLPVEDRVNNFREVDLPMTEAEALAEAERCLNCGACSECLECVAACDRGAINHDMQDEILDVNVGTIILATGFKDFDPSIAPELGYGVLDNVVTAMEFERLINSSGPTAGKVTLKNGQAPKSVAVLHCVGSRDKKYHEYCSRACCMYSLKLSQLVHEYVGAEVYEVYRDMRSFGKGYEEFFNRTEKMGVNFYHGRVKGIKKKGKKLLVNWEEAFFNQPDHIEVDMVILATGFEPQADAAHVAGTFGISRSGSGFFQEKHPKLAPVETVSEGIYLAGTCQSPKDIPDSVAQAGAAAAAALSLIDQGTIALDPVIAEVNKVLCTGCGLCAEACPYGSIQVENRTSVVNSFLCKGCGTCAAACRNKAITLIHYEDRQIIHELVGVLTEDQQ